MYTVHHTYAYIWGTYEQIFTAYRAWLIMLSAKHKYLQVDHPSDLLWQTLWLWVKHFSLLFFYRRRIIQQTATANKPKKKNVCSICIKIPYCMRYEPDRTLLSKVDSSSFLGGRIQTRKVE